MDIQYLLFLQNFRNNINDALTPFMEWASMFATTYLILFAIYLFIKSPVDNKFKIISAHTETFRNYDLLAILPPQMPICGRWKE